MTVQLEVIKFRDLVPVTTISRFVPGLELTLEITGEDFSSVEEVRFNEIPSPEFIIVNKSTIWAQLPEGAKSGIRNVQVISSAFTKTAAASTITFAIGKKTKAITGILKLTQLFTKWVLQSPTSDIFNPSRGGGLQEVVGKVLSSKRMEPVMAAVTRAVSNTANQMRSVQANNPGLPLDERLLSAAVVGMDVQESEMRASIRVRLRSMSGENAVSLLDL